MGYDMYVVDEQGVKVPVPEGVDRWDSDYYWRRNLSGGYTQAKELVEHGMAYWPTESLEYTSCRCKDKFTEDDWDNDDQHYCCKLNEHMLSVVDSDTPGINAAKLCVSNDGWHVTALECEVAVARWELASKPDIDFGMGDCIPFLRRAAQHSGFRVW